VRPTIRTMANPFKLEEKFVNAIHRRWCVRRDARERIMTKLAAQWSEQHTTRSTDRDYGCGPRETSGREGMEAGILFRGNPGDSALRDARPGVRRPNARGYRTRVPGGRRRENAGDEPQRDRASGSAGPAMAPRVF